MKSEPGIEILKRCCMALLLSVLAPPVEAPAETYTPMRNTELAVTHGEVVIRSRDVHGDEIYAIVKAYKAGAAEKIAGYGSPNVELELPSGVYDIEVYYDELFYSEWLRGISVSPGTRQEVTVAFEFGRVDVHVLDPDGKEHYSSVKAFKPGADEETAVSRNAHARLILPVGAYDIEIYSMDLYTSIWLKGIQVADGDHIEKTVQFSDGRASTAAAENVADKEGAAAGEKTEERPIIRTEALYMTGLAGEDRIIKTEALYMTGLTDEDRIIRTEALYMTGLTDVDRIIRTEMLTMTGLDK